MFSENHIYTLYYIYKKGFHYRLPTIMKKNLHLFFLSFLVLYKLCIIKIYLCTKDFFVVFNFFFPHGMVMGVRCVV